MAAKWTGTLAQRFWPKVAIGAECWEWQAGTYPAGYGAFAIGRKMRQAHRVSWELARGPIPTGLRVCHTCDNPPCVNPAHLFLGTGLDNSWDMMRKHRHPTKLSEEQVLTIYRSSTPTKTIARKFGVDPKTAFDIRRGKIWRHLTGAPAL